MKTKFFLIFTLIFFSCILTGCSEQQQIHQKLIVQGIGVDLCEKGYTITVQALDFQNPVNEKEPNIKTLEISGSSLVEALENISKQTSLSPVYSQNMVLIINEEVAKSGINNFIDFFVRHCESRPKVKICITKNKCNEIFKLKQGNKPIKTKDIHDLVPEELNSDILHFVSNLKSSISDPYAAWLEISNQDDEKNICLKGIGIFAGDTLKEFIDDDNALGFMILKGVAGFEACTVNPKNEGEITCLVDKISDKISVTMQNDIPEFNIGLDCGISVFSADKKFSAHFDESIKNLIRDELSKKIEHLCVNIIKKCITSGIDVFDWGKTLKNMNTNYFKSIESKWREEIRKCTYKIDRKININVTGKEVL